MKCDVMICGSVCGVQCKSIGKFVENFVVWHLICARCMVMMVSNNIKTKRLFCGSFHSQNHKKNAGKRNVESWIVRRTTKPYRWFIRFLHVRSHIVVLQILGMCIQLHAATSTKYRLICVWEVNAIIVSLPVLSVVGIIFFNSFESNEMCQFSFSFIHSFESIILTTTTGNSFMLSQLYYVRWNCTQVVHFVCTNEIIISIDWFVFCW